ncbi:MAG: flagellar export protein FliJ [Pseudomonadota bacterium]
MKARDAALRQKLKFEADDKRRKVEDLEMMIRDFEAMADDLTRQIQAEEDRTGVRDPSHFAYSTFARSAGQRREKLASSVAELQERLAQAVVDRDEALTELGDIDPTTKHHRPETLTVSDAYSR